MPESETRPFLIPVRRRWTLWILPILALLYFAFIITLALLRFEVRGVPMDWLVLGGLAFFAFVVLVQLPFFLRRRAPRPEPEPEEAFAPDAEASPYAPAMPYAPTAPPARPAANDETLITSEEKQGLRVLEYSAPAKSRTPGAVYAKSYVPVTKEHVLRVESLAAESHEL